MLKKRLRREPNIIPFPQGACSPQTPYFKASNISWFIVKYTRSGEIPNFKTRFYSQFVSQLQFHDSLIRIQGLLSTFTLFEYI